MIRLAIVDDHPAIADAVAAAASGRPDIEVVGRATTLADALELVERVDPDVVLCDIWIDGAADGLEVVRRFGRSVRPRVLVLSAFDQPSFLRTAVEAGAAGYLPKSADVGAIVDAVVAVAGGGTLFPEAALRAMRDAPRQPSSRELEAIRLLAAGATNDEIAAGLGISVKTVESHLRRLFGRYGLLSRTELAMLAVREGWLPPAP